MVGKIDLDRCKSTPQALAPSSYTNKLIELAPDPKGPNCKTEFPLSARTIETIRLHGQKKSAVPPRDIERISYALVAQATLAVSPFKNQPRQQTKVAQSTPMQRVQGKENKERRTFHSQR